MSSVGRFLIRWEFFKAFLVPARPAYACLAKNKFAGKRQIILLRTLLFSVNHGDKNNRRRRNDKSGGHSNVDDIDCCIFVLLQPSINRVVNILPHERFDFGCHIPAFASIHSKAVIRPMTNAVEKNQ